MSIEWFLKSLETGKAIDTAEFLLTIEKESKKRKANEDPEKDEVRFKKLKDVLLANYHKLVGLVDERFPVDSEYPAWNHFIAPLTSVLLWF